MINFPRIYFIAVCLFLFLNGTNVLASENITRFNPAQNTGLVLDYALYDSSILTFKISYPEENTSVYDSPDNAIYFRYKNPPNEYSNSALSLYYQNQSNQKLYIDGFDCASQYQVTMPDQWNNQQTYCKLSVGSEIILTPYQIKCSPYSSWWYSNNPLSKNEIDSQCYSSYGVDDILEVSNLAEISILDKQGSQIGQRDSFFIAYPNAPSFPLGSIAPPVINGVCGTAHNQSFTSRPESNLCSVGTASSVLSNPYQGWYWFCIGENGGTNDACIANLTTTNAEQPQCGIATFMKLTTEPTSEQACSQGSIANLATVNDYYTWDCVIQNQTQACQSLPVSPFITPILPSSPDQINCENLGTCISSLGAWLFLPRQETLDKLTNIQNDLSNRAPFGYFYALASKWQNIAIENNPDMHLSFDYHGTEIVLFDSVSVRESLGENLASTYWFGMQAILWINFSFWCWFTVKNIFKKDEQ